MADVGADRVIVLQRRRAVIASTIDRGHGRVVRLFLYGTAAALVFPQLFFPGGSNYSGVLASFATAVRGVRGAADRGGHLRARAAASIDEDNAAVESGAAVARQPTSGIATAG